MDTINFKVLASFFQGGSWGGLGGPGPPLRANFGTRRPAAAAQNCSPAAGGLSGPPRTSQEGPRPFKASPSQHFPNTVPDVFFVFRNHQELSESLLQGEKLRLSSRGPASSLQQRKHQMKCICVVGQDGPKP